MELNKEVAMEEIMNVIKEMKLNKSPGLDGFMAIYYKKFKEELTPILKDLMSVIIKEKKTPKSWSEAYITLNLKEQQDPTMMKSYMPISLLNEDYKVYAKIWANRLKTFLVNFILEDQSGFLPGRYIQDNVWCIINTFEFYDKNPDYEACWFFIDAEKVFDNINWEFMYEVIKKLDLHPNLLNAIYSIYTNQLAAIKVNNDTSRYFKIEKGMWQGCPLSPLLFIMVIEFMLIDIRKERYIKGLKHKRFEYKIRAFMDDLVFILEDPINSIPKTIQAIQDFGEITGFYLNQSKSKLLLKNIPKNRVEQIKNLTDCEIVNKIKYLGVTMTGGNIDLF